MTTMADWDLIEPDGETSEEMIEVAEREKLMAEMDRRHSNQTTPTPRCTACVFLRRSAWLS